MNVYIFFIKLMNKCSNINFVKLCLISNFKESKYKYSFKNKIKTPIYFLAMLYEIDMLYYFRENVKLLH